MASSNVTVRIIGDADDFQAGIRAECIEILVAGGMDREEAERQVDERIATSRAEIEAAWELERTDFDEPKNITEEGTPCSA
jgi:hypothetical protein